MNINDWVAWFGSSYYIHNNLRISGKDFFFFFNYLLALKGGPAFYGFFDIITIIIYNILGLTFGNILQPFWCERELNNKKKHSRIVAG